MEVLIIFGLAAIASVVTGIVMELSRSYTPGRFSSVPSGQVCKDACCAWIAAKATSCNAQGALNNASQELNHLNDLMRTELAAIAVLVAAAHVASLIPIFGPAAAAAIWITIGLLTAIMMGHAAAAIVALINLHKAQDAALEAQNAELAARIALSDKCPPEERDKCLACPPC